MNPPRPARWRAEPNSHPLGTAQEAARASGTYSDDLMRCQVRGGICPEEHHAEDVHCINLNAAQRSRPAEFNCSMPHRNKWLGSVLLIIGLLRSHPASHDWMPEAGVILSQPKQRESPLRYHD